MSYNVRFVCIPSVEDVKCTLDGVVKYSVNGFANFYNISAGAHSYSVVAPEGMKFISGEDVFKRPLGESGTTTIEWILDPSVPWPTDQPWSLSFIFEAVEIPLLGEFKFDSWNPPLDTREVFIVGAAWPAVVRTVDAGEDVYAHYVAKNVGTEAGKPTVTVKDLDTGSTIATWSLPELAPNERFKTSSSGAYIGKMPSREWRLEFKVEP